MPRQIGPQDIDDIALGAAVLGAGGGGDPSIGHSLALTAVRRHGNVTLLAPYEVPDDALVLPTAMMGAPTVMMEKIPNGDEGLRAMRALERHLGRRAYATMAIECGGINALLPLATASLAGIPVIDADGMGRAFPELQMETFHICGVSGTPAVLTNERGDECLVTAHDNHIMEQIAREVTVRMGGVAYICEFPMSGRQVKEAAIAGTIDLALRIGRSLRLAPPDGRGALAAISEVTSNSNYGRVVPLFEGKISEVERHITGGFARGQVVVEGLEEFSGRSLTVEFQNENLLAILNGVVVAMVPDLIVFLDADTGTPMTTEGLQFGYRVMVLGIPTPTMMRTRAALETWGPRYFGYDVDYVPLELLHPHYYE